MTKCTRTSRLSIKVSLSTQIASAGGKGGSRRAQKYDRTAQADSLTSQTDLYPSCSRPGDLVQIELRPPSTTGEERTRGAVESTCGERTSPPISHLPEHVGRPLRPNRCKEDVWRTVSHALYPGSGTCLAKSRFLFDQSKWTNAGLERESFINTFRGTSTITRTPLPQGGSVGRRFLDVEGCLNARFSLSLVQSGPFSQVAYVYEVPLCEPVSCGSCHFH